MDSINEIIGKKTYMEAAYESGEINQGEYGEWLSEYFISESRADGVRKVYEHSEYLKELHDRGIAVYFFDGTGYELLQKTNISFLLCAALILIFADVFSYEYRCGFYAIQQSEKFGKKKDVFMKYIAVLAISAILGLLFEAVQYIYVDVFWDLSGVSYPVMCIEKTNVSREISVGAYFLLSSIRNVLFYTLTALFAGTVSRLSKRVILSLAVPTVVIFVPTVLAYFGVEIFEKINFLNLFAR
ncbi:MAG: hypothetical protein KBS59_07340 [Clostridiales bacterium]|nr:hypothetical protein [Clostridiales bacterium]